MKVSSPPVSSAGYPIPTDFLLLGLVLWFSLDCYRADSEMISNSLGCGRRTRHRGKEHSNLEGNLLKTSTKSA